MEYSLGLTGGPFLYHETLIVAKLIKEGMSEKDIKKKVLEENLFQYKSDASLKRVMSPIFVRLNTLDNQLLDMFINSSINTSKQILMYAIMKTDRLFYEFMRDVYAHKIQMLENQMDVTDYNVFYEEKSYGCERLRDATDKTRYKMRQVTFKILYDSDFVDKDTLRIKNQFVDYELQNKLEELNDTDYLIAMQGR